MSDKRIGVELTEEMMREYAEWCRVHQGTTKAERKSILCGIFHRNRMKRNEMKQNETKCFKKPKIGQN